MKRTLVLLACIVPFFFGPVGCPGQVPPVTPLQSTCAPATSVAYQPLPGATNGTTALSITASSVSGQTCFVAVGSLPAANGVIAQTGNPTNVVGPTLGGATGKVGLTVTPTPTSGQTATGELWTFFSAPATTALAPANGSVGAPTTSQVVKPALPDTEAPGGTMTAKLETVKK
jgi:hypothetical protein